jgi:tetratricopeptide (TPR) repeat protein
MVSGSRNFQYRVTCTRLWQVRLAAGRRLVFRRVSATLLWLGFTLFACSARSADDPATALKLAFEAAKSAVNSGRPADAEAHYNAAIALGLRQLATLAISESRFDEAAREMEQALKFAPADLEIETDAAIAFFSAGDTNKARELAQSVVASNPRHARALNILGRIDLQTGDFDAAIRNLQASFELKDDFETAYFLGIAYLKAKRMEDGQRWFQQLQSNMEDSAALHMLFGRAYSISHFPQPAAAEFRKAVQLDPKYPHAHSLLGYSTLEFRGEEAYPLARVEFEKELKLNPDDYNALLLLGLSAVALRDFPAAETALLHAKRLRPEEFFPYLYLGEVFSATKRLPQAVEVLQKYLSLIHSPDEAPRDVSRAYYLLGQALRRLGRLAEAQKALADSQRYREAKFRYDVKHLSDEPGITPNGDSRNSDRVAALLESGQPEEAKNSQSLVQNGFREKLPAVAAPPVRRPESRVSKQYRSFVSEVLASSYNDLGVMRAKVSNFVEAAEFFKQAYSWNPRLPGLERNWGLASYRAQLFSEAIPPLERHLAANPQDILVRQLLGLSYFADENFSKTVEVFKPFEGAPPNDPGLLFAWSTALVRTRQPELAAPLFRQLLEQNAGDPNVHFLLGQAYAQQKDYTNAVGEFDAALKIDPNLAEAHYYKGLVYLRQTNFQSAIAEFRSELQIHPGEPVISYHLGYALLALGDTDSAIAILRSVAATKPDYELARLALGRALLNEGDLAGAVENLEAAKRLDPTRDTTYFQLSQAYRRSGRTAEAQQALNDYNRLIEANRQKRREQLETETP